MAERSGKLEIILVLSIKVVALYIWMARVKVEISGFGKFVQGIFSNFGIKGYRGLVSDLFNISLHELLEKFVV